MEKQHIKKIIHKLEESLYPSLGKVSRIDIYGQKKLIFSEVCKIILYYETTTKHMVLKKYIKEKGPNTNQRLSVKNEYNILKHLHNNFLSLQGINVIKPIAVLLDEDILITEEFDGDKLDALIVNDARWIPSKEEIRRMELCFFQSGRWLRYFQKFTKKEGAISFRQDYYVENIKKRLGLSIKYGLEEPFHKKIYRFINDTCKNIGYHQLDVVGYHGDFTPWNILASADEIRVLDFDRFSYRNRYDDLTLFLSVLEGKKSVVGVMDKNIDALKDAFLQGYGTERINHDIFGLYMLKNTLKALNMIDIYKDANDNLTDMLYEKYRKRKRIKLYLRYIGDLIDNKL